MAGKRKIAVITLGVMAPLVLAGIAFAGGVGIDDDGDQRLTGKTREQAVAAALKATDGGKATETELDSENGATYEVEVKRTDGSSVDVRLDESFDVVVIEGDSEKNDADD